MVTCGSEATIVRNVMVRNCRAAAAVPIVRLKLRPDTPMAERVRMNTLCLALATLGQAGAQVDLGKPKDAVALYDAVLADATTERLARATALQGKATALEAAGDAAAARAAWGELGALDPQAYGLMAGLQAGRLLEKMGKTAEARSHYEKLQKDFDAALGEFAGRAYKAEIERRLGQLGDAS